MFLQQKEDLIGLIQGDSLEARPRLEKLIFQMTVDAMGAFQRGELGRFDALVGDQACQIRGLQVALMARNPDLHEEIQVLKPLFIAALGAPSSPPITVSQDLFSLIRLYILAEAQEIREVEIDARFYFRAMTSLRRLPERSRFLKRQFWSTLGRLKEATTLDSVNFVQQQASKLESAKELQGKVGTVSKIQGRWPKGGELETAVRWELPCFFQSQVMFRRAIEERVPVLLKIRSWSRSVLDPASYKCRALFVGRDGDFVPVDAVPQDQACYVLEGHSCSERLDLSHMSRLLEAAGGLMGFLEKVTAQHKQFSDGSCGGLSSEDSSKIRRLAEEAEVLGFTRSNNRLCCLEHIYCDSLSRQGALAFSLTGFAKGTIV